MQTGEVPVSKVLAGEDREWRGPGVDAGGEEVGPQLELETAGTIYL